MAIAPLPIKPGIYTEASDRTAIDRYRAGTNVHFFKGFAQKWLGCAKAVTDQFLGVCRALVSWTTLTGSRHVGLGTSSKLYVLHGGTYYDVTPLRDSGTLGADPFSVVSGSSTVAVADVGHGLTAGDYIHFSSATAVGGLDPNGDWTVDAVTDVDHYTFTHTGVASSSASGGGAAVAYGYEITLGLVDSVAGGGWGGGAWGAGTWGTPRDIVEQARTWSLPNWGEDMIGSPWKGAAYVWDASAGTATRATVITNAPAQNIIVLVSPENRQLVSFGGTDPDTGVLDPMLVQFSDEEDYTNWTPLITNRAGSKRLDHGNAIVTALISRGGFVVVTDKTLYTMTLSGDEFVWDFKSEGECPGGVGPCCAFDVNGTVYYMGRGQFVKFTGQIEILDCDVLSFVFTVDVARGFLGINMLQSAKVYCGRNKSKSMLLWFYCSADSDEIDRCVGYCYLLGSEHWWLGDEQQARTAWLDENTLVEEPIATSALSYLYVQEFGVNNDGAALSYSLQSYDMEIPAGQASGPGEFLMKIRRFVPDYQRIVGNHSITLKGRKKPNGPVITSGPKTFSDTDDQIGIKIRARQVSVLIEGNEIGNDISLGEWRVDSQAVSLK